MKDQNKRLTKDIKKAKGNEKAALEQNQSKLKAMIQESSEPPKKEEIV